MPEGYEIVSVVRTKTDEPITDVIEGYLPWADGKNKHSDDPDAIVGGTLSGSLITGGSLKATSRMGFSDFKRKDF